LVRDRCLQVSINRLGKGWVPWGDISAPERQSKRGGSAGQVRLPETQPRGTEVKGSEVGGNLLPNHRKASGLTCRQLV